jgi:hypothetical protein
MQAPYQDAPPTEESLEGDAAHWVAHTVAMCYAHPEGVELGALDFPRLKEKAPNGVEITQDMLDGAELWADTIGAAPGNFINLESRVAVMGVHPHCYGTPDADKMGGGVLDVYDYKFGHRFVEVFENWQTLAYVKGVIETRLGGVCPDKVRVTIVQPRSYNPAGPVRSWPYSAQDIYTLTGKLHERAHAAVDMDGRPKPDAPATTGPECRDCKARHACTLFQSVAARIVDSSGRADLFELPPAQLGAELSYLDETLQRLEARRNALAIQAETLLAKGQSVPGYAMESSPGNLSWNDGVDVDEVAMLGATLGAALIRDPQPVTPTQAKTILKRRAIDDELLGAYTSRPRGKMKLTRSNTIKARKAFGVNR